MSEDLLNLFLKRELDENVKQLILRALKDHEEVGSKVAIRSFELNCFDVILDFERDVVILVDVLSSGSGGEQIVSLNFFIDACGLGESR